MADEKIIWVSANEFAVLNLLREGAALTTAAIAKQLPNHSSEVIEETLNDLLKRGFIATEYYFGDKEWFEIQPSGVEFLAKYGLVGS